MRRIRLTSCVVLAATLVSGADGLSTSAAAATPGSRIWTERYNGPGNSFDGGVDDAVSPDGSTVFVTGYSYDSATGADYATLAYDTSTSALRWTSRYDGPAAGDDRVSAVAVSPDGSTVFVTGFSGSSASWDFATVAYDASSGATLWTKRYDGPGSGDDGANALGISPAGDVVFVTGFSTGSTTARDFATVAHDASTGERLWVKRYNGPRDGDDGARALAVSPDGSKVFVTGRSRSTTGFDYATVAYRAGTGLKRWIERYDGPTDAYPWSNDDAALDIGISPDGSSVFVTGYTATSSYTSGATTIAYDASSGASRWLRLYEGPENFRATPNALAVSPDGSSVFLAGDEHSNATGSDYMTVAYDASTGDRLWAKRYVGLVLGGDEWVGNGVANDVVASLDGSTVIVTGHSATYPDTYRYVTIAYDATTGAKRWARHYDNQGASYDNNPDALDVSGSAVFVTGRSSDPSSTHYVTDIATIAYALP
jgi:WD40 repeat protein